MKKSYSLKGKRCFSGVFNSGKRFRARGLQCTVAAGCGMPGVEGFTCNRKNDSDVKIGIVINRRYGKAHERNKAKRRLKAICSSSLPGFKGGQCMMIKITDDFKHMSYQDAGAAFEQMMKKAGVLE